MERGERSEPTQEELRKALTLLALGCCGREKIPIVKVAALLHIDLPALHKTSLGVISPATGPRSFAVYAVESFGGRPYAGQGDPISDLCGLVEQRLAVVDSGP